MVNFDDFVDEMLYRYGNELYYVLQNPYSQSIPDAKQRGLILEKNIYMYLKYRIKYLLKE